MDDLEKFLKAYREYLKHLPHDDVRFERLARYAKKLYQQMGNEIAEPDVEVPEVFIEALRDTSLDSL